MLKLKHPIVFFDLETTGVDPLEDRIVEIAAIKFFPTKKGDIDLKNKQELHHLLNPCIHIPSQASDVHGIYDDDVKECLTFKKKAKDFYKFFKLCYLSGYNIKKFDVPLLTAEFKRCGIKFPRPPIIDAYQIFLNKFPHTLAGAHRYYCKKDFDGAHSALTDTEATINVFLKQLQVYDDLEGSPQQIEKKFNDGSLDLLGKLKRNNKGELCLSFGKHKGIPLIEVPSDYMDWLYSGNIIGPDGWEIIRKELK